jgi:hypothetical protein
MFEHANSGDKTSSIPLTEQIISLSEAAKLLPRRRGGKKTNVATLYRWTNRGLKGIVLDSIQIGGSRCTSREALERFFGQLTERPPQRLPQPAVDRRRKDHDRIQRRLDDLGI